MIQIWKHPSSAPPTEGGWVRFAIIHQYHNLPPHRLHHHHNHHRITQVSDDLLRQMGSVDYEAVQRDLTLLMTDSQVVITLHYSQAVNTRMIRILWVVTMVKGLLSQSWHIHIQYVTLLPGIMASRLWSLWASYGEACLAQLGLLQVMFIMMLIMENAWKLWWLRFNEWMMVLMSKRLQVTDIFQAIWWSRRCGRRSSEVGIVKMLKMFCSAVFSQLRFEDPRFKIWTGEKLGWQHKPGQGAKPSLAD